MDEEGRAEDLTEPRFAESFATFNMRTIFDPEKLAALGPTLHRAQEVLSAFYAGKTSMDVYEQGQARRLLIGMVASPADIADNHHLAARKWWVELEQPAQPRHGPRAAQDARPALPTLRHARRDPASRPAHR